jgi:hypothetical protein
LNYKLFLVDSIPHKNCKIAGHSRIKICKDNFYTAPDEGFFASKNTWFYDNKLQGVCKISGFFQLIDRTEASLNDFQHLYYPNRVEQIPRVSQIQQIVLVKI